jgi:protease I
MKALLIIAPNRFRDEEYFDTKEALEGVGIEVTTASRSTDTATGMLGRTITPDISLRDVDADEYDAIVFIGGGGSSVYFNNPAAQDIAKKAVASDKVLAAICIAPSILANAGLLKGKQATAFPSEQGNLRAKGANWTGNDVTVDGRLITADGPEAARKFGLAIARKLGA